MQPVYKSSFDNPDFRLPWPFRIFFWVRRRGGRLESAKRRLAARLFKVLFDRMYRGRVTFEAIDNLASDEKARWSDAAIAPVRLSIIVVTYKQPVQLDCLLSSFACQTLQNFEVIVLHDGADQDTREVMDRFRARSERFRYVETEIRYNDYGHSLRAAGIEMASSEFLMITNGDNYYTPRFAEFAFDAIDSHRLDVAVWDIVHSYNDPGLVPQRSYNPFHIYPARWMFDISAMIARTDLARAAGFTDKSNDGDATYLEQVLTKTSRPIKVGKIQKTLNVHN